MLRLSIPRALLLSTLCWLGISTQARAAKSVSAPVLDVKSQLMVDPSNQVIGGPLSTFFQANLITTGYPNYLPIPPYVQVPVGTPNSHLCGCSDNIAWYGGGPIYPERVVGVTYITSDSTGQSTDAVLTTVYGIDLNPTLAGSESMTGYSMTSPQVGYTNERILGGNGVSYSASSSQLVSISNLGSYLGAGFDLTPFQSGDPATGVYVFQTTIPQAALGAVPEPASMMLIGFVAIMGTQRRSRM